MLSIHHATLAYIRKRCLALQCRLDNLSPSKIPDVITHLLNEQSCNPLRGRMWQNHLVTLVTETAIFSRSLPRALRRDWLFRLMVDAGNYIPAVSRFPMPPSLLARPGMMISARGIAHAPSVDTVDEQCYFLVSHLIPEIVP